MTCPNCGERLLGDGYSTPLVCPNAADALAECLEPDAPPYFCPLVHVSVWKGGEPVVSHRLPDR